VSNCATRSAPSSNSCAEPSRSCARNSIRRTSRSEAVDSDIKTQAGHSGSSLRPVRGAAVAFGRRCENVSCCRSERTFGTRMAAAGVPPRTLQEWMGHRDFTSTPIYADYQPSEQEAASKGARAASDRDVARVDVVRMHRKQRVRPVALLLVVPCGRPPRRHDLAAVLGPACGRGCRRSGCRARCRMGRPARPRGRARLGSPPGR
jgi:hypothetical protein